MRVVAMLAWWSSALVAAVARSEWAPILNPSFREYLGHPCVSEEIKIRDQNAKAGDRPYPDTATAIEGEAEMSDEEFDIVRGSGNVFRDLGHPDADREQLRSLLAARVIGVLDERKLTVREAHDLTGFAVADFSRIRRAKLDRFTIDQLMSMLARLGQQVEVTVSVHPPRLANHGTEARF